MMSVQDLFSTVSVPIVQIANKIETTFPWTFEMTPETHKHDHLGSIPGDCLSLDTLEVEGKLHFV